MNKSKTIFCDIDGTLIFHVGNVNQQALSQNMTLLNNTKEAINLWDKLNYKIILTTGRKESLREKTIDDLKNIGIVYDQLIMGLGGGERILINDKKINGNKNTAYSINLTRNKGLHYFDFTSNFIIIPDEQPSIVIKPWGKEELIEYNDNYIMKKLTMNKNESCSLQYHEIKRETLYVLKGQIQLTIGTNIENLDTKIMNVGDNITIQPYTIHKVTALEDSEYIECSTIQIWDIVRLEDNYNRQNTEETDYK